VSLDCWEGLRKHFFGKLIVMERDRVGAGDREGPDTLFQAEGAYALVEIKGSAVPRTAGKTARRRNGSRKGH
jgi:hypothetical protein